MLDCLSAEGLESRVLAQPKYGRRVLAKAYLSAVDPFST
jgi:hypothetical protein